VIKYELKY